MRAHNGPVESSGPGRRRTVAIVDDDDWSRTGAAEILSKDLASRSERC